jgi:hypothetical protein|tara:strand:- start:145 stop:396 length:252 start_codon:yes stop_codon:yes gene_type:complete
VQKETAAVTHLAVVPEVAAVKATVVLTVTAVAAVAETVNLGTVQLMLLEEMLLVAVEVLVLTLAVAVKVDMVTGVLVETVVAV